MDATEEKIIGNYLIEIIPDEDPESPREWDNFGKMICFHGSYRLGDKHDYNHKHYSGWEEMEKAIIKQERAVAILPLFLYDHSGITMNTSGFGCPWDSGQVGFIVAPREVVLNEFGIKRITQKIRKKVLDILHAEVKTYDQYLTGDIYGYKVSRITLDEDGDIEDKEEVDSCWGFYGEDECMKEAEFIVEYYIKEDNEHSEVHQNS